MNENLKPAGDAALQLYKKGYKKERNPFALSEMPESKSFYLALRAAIIEDLENTGFCTLADMLLCGTIKRIDGIVLAVFADIAENYRKGTLLDVKNDPEYSRTVPYLSKKETRNPMSNISISINSSILFKRSELLEYSENYVVNEEVVGVIYDAVREVRNAHVQEFQKLQQEKTETDALREAEKAGNGIIAEAKAKAAQIVSDAERKAEDIQLSAGEAAERILAEAKKEKEAQAAERADELVKKYIAEEQKSLKREADSEVAAQIASNKETLQRGDVIHEQMCDRTKELQATWVKAMNDTITGLQSIRSELYSHLHEWQSSLYPSELRPLAQRFLDLYRIVNVDKLIREELVFQQSKDEEGASAPSENVIAGLQRLNTNLTTFLRRFEVSLNGLGMYVFYPAENELFDELWHISESEDTDCEGKRIAKCITPGIAKRSALYDEDDVLIRAEVSVYDTESEK